MSQMKKLLEAQQEMFAKPGIIHLWMMKRVLHDCNMGCQSTLLIDERGRCWLGDKYFWVVEMPRAAAARDAFDGRS